MRRYLSRRKPFPPRKGGLRRLSQRRRLDMDMDRHARIACLVAAGGRCEKCGDSSLRLEWHHVITRRVRALRWDPKNAVCLCPTCHRWWHANPAAALEWFVLTFGELRLSMLYRLRNNR